MPDLDPARDWSAVAPAWDTHAADVEEHTAPLIEALVDRLTLKPGDRVLELAAGPGTLGPRFAELVGDEGHVVLSDIAPGMVEVATRRNAAIPNVEVALLDASRIDQPDGSFEAVACQMGLMFTPDPTVALGEIHRVLVPGGRIAALTWGGLEHNPWMTSVGMAAMMAGLPTGGPPVGPGTIFSLADPDLLRKVAEGAGFLDVVVEDLPVTFRTPDVDTHIDRVGSLAGPLAGLIRAASQDQAAAFRRAATDLAAPYLSDSGLEIPGRALLVSGRR